MLTAIFTLSGNLKRFLLVKKSIKISALLFIFASVFLKIAGLMRDIVIAYYFGDSYLADAFLAAFLLPNMLILFIQNGTKDVLIPGYYQYVQEKRENIYLFNVTISMLVFGAIVSLLVYTFAPTIIQAFYPSFIKEAQSIATTVIRIMMLVFVLVCLNAVLDSLLDIKRRYPVPVWTQSIIWVTMIGFAIIFANRWGVLSLAYGYITGVIVSSIIKLFTLKLDWWKKLSASFDFSMTRHYFAHLFPVGFTIMIGQINLTVDSIFAGSFDEGAITYLNYAKSLVHLPQTLIPVMVGTILFPIISKYYSENKIDKFQSTVKETFHLTFFLSLPAIVGMGIILLPLIRLIYERGAFDALASLSTATTGYYYLGSALFFSINVVWNKALYTMQKGKYIFRISCISILLNIVLNYVLSNTLGFIGIPLASSIVGFYYTLATGFIYQKLSSNKMKMNKTDLIVTIISTICMVLGIFFIQSTFSTESNVMLLIAQIITGIILYVGVSFILKSYSLQFLTKIMSRK